MFPRTAAHRLLQSLGCLVILLVPAAGCRSPLGNVDAGAGPADARPPATGERPDEPVTVRIRADLVAREIQPGAWEVTHERPLSANSLVVRAADGSVILVDTPWTPEATRALLEWIDATLAPTSKRALNTHFHLDALGGNAALRDARVATQGLVTTAELLKERGEARRRELVESLEDPDEKALFAGLEMIPPPSRFMAARYRQPLGPETFEIVFPGAGHSPDNVAVWFPERRLLFGGCMVKGGSSLGFLGDADLDSWPNAIRQLQALDPEIVVPGHGPRLDARLLQHTLDLLEAATGERGDVTGPTR